MNMIYKVYEFFIKLWVARELLPRKLYKSVLGIWNKIFLGLDTASIYDPSDFTRSIFVYDKLDENSMFAAALLKRYGFLNVVEQTLVDRRYNVRGNEVFWLGAQPERITAIALSKVRISALIPRANEFPKESNTRILSGNYDSVAEMVLDTVLMLAPGGISVTQEVVDECKNMAYLVSQFRADVKGQFKDNEQKSPAVTAIVPLANAYKLLSMAYQYLVFDTEWNVRMAEDDHDPIVIEYLQSVKKVKHWISKNIRSDLHSTKNSVQFRYYVEHLDHHWYLLQRIALLSSQRLLTTRVFNGVPHDYECSSTIYRNYVPVV